MIKHRTVIKDSFSKSLTTVKMVKEVGQEKFYDTIKLKSATKFWEVLLLSDGECMTTEVHANAEHLDFIEFNKSGFRWKLTIDDNGKLETIKL